MKGQPIKGEQSRMHYWRVGLWRLMRGQQPTPEELMKGALMHWCTEAPMKGVLMQGALMKGEEVTGGE